MFNIASDFVSNAYSYCFYGYTISRSNNELTWEGNKKSSLQLACQTILNSTIKSATFDVPSEMRWYGRHFRINDLNLQPIQEMLAQTTCPLEALKINDRCLRLSELADLCNKLSKETILKRLTIQNVIIENEEERTSLQNLEKELSARNIVMIAIEEFNPTFGTTYH